MAKWVRISQSTANRFKTSKKSKWMVQKWKFFWDVKKKCGNLWPGNKTTQLYETWEAFSKGQWGNAFYHFIRFIRWWSRDMRTKAETSSILPWKFIEWMNDGRKYTEKGGINVISVLIQSWNAVRNRWVKKYMWKQFYSQRAHSWNMHKAQSHQVEFNWLQLFNVVFLPPSILFALFWNGLSVCAFYNLFLLHFFQPLFSF